VITAIVGTLIIIPFFWFSDTYALIFLVQLVACLAAGEMLNCAGMLKTFSISVPCEAAVLAVPVFTRYFVSGVSFFVAAEIIFFVLAFYLLSVSVFLKNKIQVSDTALVFIMLFYITVSMSCVVMLRNEEHGEYIYFLVFISAWFSDSAAYFTGKTFGKHKLIPSVSPKKTVEGAIGGLVACVIAFLVYGCIIGNVLNLTPNYLLFAVSGLLMSVVSMLGDLIASLVKRYYEIKDYGNLLPGHGGVLDRFDSVFATAPFLMLLFTLFNNFTLFK